MVSSSQGVEAALRAAGVRAELRTFDQPLPTAAAATLALGCEVGAIANSLVFELDGKHCWCWPAALTEWTPRSWPEGSAWARFAVPPRTSSWSTLGNTLEASPGGAPSPNSDRRRHGVGQLPSRLGRAGDERSMFPTDFPQLLALTGGIAAAVA